MSQFVGNVSCRWLLTEWKKKMLSLYLSDIITLFVYDHMEYWKPLGRNAHFPSRDEKMFQDIRCLKSGKTYDKKNCIAGLSYIVNFY